MSSGFIIEGLLFHEIKLTELWLLEALSVIIHIHAHIDEHGCTSRTFGGFTRNPLSVLFNSGPGVRGLLDTPPLSSSSRQSACEG